MPATARWSSSAFPSSSAGRAHSRRTASSGSKSPASRSGPSSVSDRDRRRLASVRSSMVGVLKATATASAVVRTALASLAGRRQRSPGRYRCQEPVMRRWLRSVRPLSKPMSRCLPRGSTLVTVAPTRRDRSGTRRSPGWGCARASVIRRSRSAARSTSAVRKIVSPSGMRPLSQPSRQRSDGRCRARWVYCGPPPSPNWPVSARMKIGIDLGTANILVYVKGKGVVLNEPSVVAIREDDNKLVAVGEEAREMIGRTPGNVRAIRPMRDGVIADYLITEAMLRYVLKKVASRIQFFKPEVMISVPSGVTSVEKRAVRDAALKAGAKDAYLIEEPLAAAIGSNVPISGPSGNLIIDIGGGTSEIAAIALGGIVVSTSLRVGGNRFDEAIANYIRRKYNLMIGDRTAEDVKIQIGSALPLDEPLRMEVKGRDMIAGLPRTIPITSTEITEAIEQPLQAIITAVRNVLEQTPPELSSDIIDKGMVMTGGGALLRNLDKLLTQVTGIPCHVAENALNSVAVGTGMALEHFGSFRKSLVSHA